MKNSILTLILTALCTTIFGQNLISNGNFQDAKLEPLCDGWYNNCGEELTAHCNTNGYCFVALIQDSPSFIPEEIWSLTVKTYFAPEGYAETYITGQSGTNIYQLSYWMKATDWIGGARIGIGKHSKFVESTSRIDTASNWQQFTITDTLTTLSTDTITVRLTASEGDFCICPPVRFDLVEFVKKGSVATRDIHKTSEVRVYPNPSGHLLKVELPYKTNQEMVLMDVVNVLGQKTITKQTEGNSFVISKEETGPGVFFYIIRSVRDREVIGRGRLMFE